MSEISTPGVVSVSVSGTESGSILLSPFWWLGGAVGLALVVIAFLIAVRSIRTEQRTQRKAAARPAVRAALFEHLGRETPAWDEWVARLSTIEREVLCDLLDEYLRLLDGSDREQLQPLAVALDIPSWATDTLETGDRYTKLTALDWLALVDHPPVPDLLVQACIDDVGLRAAAARVVIEQEYSNTVALGLRLLLEGRTEPLSAFGLDTLYQLTKSRPNLLVEHARFRHSEWDPALLTQVFLVIQHVGLLDVDTTLAWIIDQCEHDSPTVRAAAVRSLADSGWRPEVRSRFPTEILTSDPSPAVRQAVYRTLGDWSDADACTALYRAAHRESDPRSCFVAMMALYRSRCRDRLDVAIRREFPQLWEWIAATETEMWARGES